MYHKPIYSFGRYEIPFILFAHLSAGVLSEKLPRRELTTATLGVPPDAAEAFRRGRNAWVT